MRGRRGRTEEEEEGRRRRCTVVTPDVSARAGTKRDRGRERRKRGGKNLEGEVEARVYIQFPGF